MLLVGLTACGQAQPDQAGPGGKTTGGSVPTDKAAFRPGVSHWFEIAMGNRPVEMQLAITLPEMQRGLMERREVMCVWERRWRALEGVRAAIWRSVCDAATANAAPSSKP